MASSLAYEDNFGSLHSQSNTFNETQSPRSISPRRKALRTQSTRTSDGTVNTMASFSSGQRSDGPRRSDLTQITMPSEQPSYNIKLVVVGDGGCGKTCLLISYSAGIFPERYVPTVFENYFCTRVHEPSGKLVELALWDTAGQEEYDRLRPLSYPEANIIFICFAIDCPASLENVWDKWHGEVIHFCPAIPIILVGLKSDLRYKKTCIDLLRTQGLTPVTTSQGRNMAQRMGAQYVECSSKEMTGVNELFNLAINTAVSAREARFNPNSADNLAGGGGNRGRRRGKKCTIM